MYLETWKQDIKIMTAPEMHFSRICQDLKKNYFPEHLKMAAS